MRKTQSSFFSLLAIGALLFSGCGKSGDAPKLSVPSPATAAKDEDLIQGKWFCVEHSEDGVRHDQGGGIRAVFTTKEAKIGSELGATAYQYRLVADSQPKRCELVIPGVVTRRLAYKLEGDSLILASHLAEEQDTPAPKSLEPAPGIAVSKFRRIDAGARPTTKEEKTLSAEDEVALQVLRQQLASFRERFEKQQYDELLAEMVAPDTRRKLQESPEEKAQFLGRMKRMGDSFARLLAAIETQRPVFNSSRSRASFDTRLIHFDGLPGMPQITFQKEGDTWFMGDR